MICRLVHVGLLCSFVIGSLASCTPLPPAAGSADARTIVFEPEPVTKLHPKLTWMRTDRIRGAWVADDLNTPYGNTDRTKAQVMADGGFNLAVVSIHSDPKNRSRVPDLAKLISTNVRAAHENGMALWTKWNYGTQHQEPYHRYRAPDGTLAKKTCCPLDKRYIDRHVGRWAVRFAKAGADGFVLDTEMYGSDQADYAGHCVCDYCFRAYLDVFEDNSDAIYDSVKRLAQAVQLPIEIHCHNDLGYVVANSVEGAMGAIDAGVDAYINTCINGMGERAGNADLVSVILAIKKSRGLKDRNILDPKIDLTLAWTLSNYTSRAFGVPIPINQVGVGANAFAHESGIHTDGMLKDRRNYELYGPEEVGRGETETVDTGRRIATGEYGGLKGLKHVYAQLGINIDELHIDSRELLQLVQYANAHNELPLRDDELRFMATYPEQVRQILTVTP